MSPLQLLLKRICASVSCLPDLIQPLFCFTFNTVDGKFGPWSAWFKCHNPVDDSSCLCRQRSCNDPEPKCGGFPCVGETMQVSNCSGTSSVELRTNTGMRHLALGMRLHECRGTTHYRLRENLSINHFTSKWLLKHLVMTFDNWFW